MADPYRHDGPDGPSSAFWRHLERGRFCLQTCRRCGTPRFPPASLCPSCHRPGSEWSPVSGRGSVWTWTTVHRPPDPAWALAVPYHLAVVALAEGPLVLGRLDLDRQPEIGLPVRLVVAPSDEGRARYHFTCRPAGA